MPLHSRSGFVAIMVGIVLLAELALAAALFSADRYSVAFAGIPISVAPSTLTVPGIVSCA